MNAARNLDAPRIISHLPRIKALARRLAARTGGHVEAEELYGAGTVGLINAAARFDEGRGVPFEAFVQARVQGAMLDLMRAGDPLSRAERSRARGTAPRLSVVPFEDAAEEVPSPSDTPLELAERAQLLAKLRQAIERLHPREQLVLSLYYERDLTYREIGQVLGVSESRVCQVVRGIQGRLKEGLDAA